MLISIFQQNVELILVFFASLISINLAFLIWTRDAKILIPLSMTFLVCYRYSENLIIDINFIFSLFALVILTYNFCYFGYRNLRRKRNIAKSRKLSSAMPIKN